MMHQNSRIFKYSSRPLTAKYNRNLNSKTMISKMRGHILFGPILNEIESKLPESKALGNLSQKQGKTTTKTTRFFHCLESFQRKCSSFLQGEMDQELKDSSQSPSALLPTTCVSSDKSLNLSGSLFLHILYGKVKLQSSTPMSMKYENQPTSLLKDNPPFLGTQETDHSY